MICSGVDWPVCPFCPASNIIFLNQEAGNALVIPLRLSMSKGGDANLLWSGWMQPSSKGVVTQRKFRQGMIGNSLERGAPGGMMSGPRMSAPRAPGMGPMSPGGYAPAMRGPPPQGPGMPPMGMGPRGAYSAAGGASAPLNYSGGSPGAYGRPPTVPPARPRLSCPARRILLIQVSEKEM
ncbi:hypothetical protein EVAR_41557_1 [Eumeta japonica]|uniref:Uncharacterized protein n=1 Tax=Eumeta variegata TaxID=151549 RepID=A0A4C1Y2P9_EUMVA|nr:hypothetical protein EVAR_41557_1 [Eumeta japonica]